MGSFNKYCRLGPKLSDSDIIGIRPGHWDLLKISPSDSNCTAKICGTQTVCVSKSPGNLIKIQSPRLCPASASLYLYILY